MYQLMLNRKQSRKGFTLVEVIVVLVILAILAAIMIPSMVKWIDKAKEKSVLVEARAVLLAAQTLASEQYATNATATTVAVGASGDTGTNTVYGLSQVKGTIGTITVAAGTVTNVVYTDTTGKKATYANGTWTLG